MISSISGWCTVGAGVLLLQIEGCNEAAAAALTEFLSGVAGAVISQIVSGLFNVQGLTSFGF